MSRSASAPADPPAPDPSPESLRRRLAEYERRFRLLDEQMRVLERERQKLSAIVHHTEAGFLVFNAAHEVAWANSVFARQFSEGPHPGALLGSACHRVLCGNGERCDVCPVARTFQQGQSARHEIRFEQRGRLRNLLITAVPIRSLTGETDQAIAMIQDVSNLEVLRRSEEALRAANDRLTTLIASAPVILFSFDRDGIITLEDGRVREYLDHDASDVVGKSLFEVYKDIPVVAGNCRRALAGEAFSTVIEYRGRFFQTQYVPQRDAQGEVCGVFGVATDVTQIKMLEERLRHAHKMEAVGALAGGVAHDFNNILTGILGYAELLKSGTLTGDRLVRAADVIEKGATRAATLTQQLLGFARKGKIQNVRIDLHGSIRDVLRNLQTGLGPRHELREALAASRPFVLGDPGQIVQALSQLAVNALEAMPEGGRLTVSTQEQRLTEPDALRLGLSGPGPYLLVCVSDTGRGIAQEVRGRLFEPFVTTKQRGQGTGMGLAMVYGMLRSHGGAVEVESESGRGTTFRLYLPLAADGSPTRADDPETAAPEAGSGRILLVDDEETVRCVAKEFLIQLGYEVTTARDGQEALQIYRRAPTDFRLVILDLVMPRLGGRETFRALRAINPNVRALLSTGYDFDDSARDLLNEGMAGFIQKPYRIADLSAAVNRALRS